MSEQMQPGRELDRLVAEAIGLPILDYEEHRGDHAWLNDSANYPYITSSVGEYLIFWVTPNAVGKTWSPSTNIDLAMEAWVWLEENHPWVEQGNAWPWQQEIKAAILLGRDYIGQEDNPRPSVLVMQRADWWCFPDSEIEEGTKEG